MGNMFVLWPRFQKGQEHQLQPRFLREGITFVTVRISHSGSVYAIDRKTCLVLG